MIVTIYDAHGRPLAPGAALGVTAPPLWTSFDIFIIPGSSQNVGYNEYAHSTRPISCICASSASASLQTFTMRFAWRPVPPGFSAFATTGAIRLGMISDSNSSANVKFTGITLYGSDLVSGTETTLYTDALARTPSAADAVEEISLDAADFADVTVPEFVSIEVSGQVANSKKLGFVWAGVFDEP